MRYTSIPRFVRSRLPQPGRPPGVNPRLGLTRAQARLRDTRSSIFIVLLVAFVLVSMLVSSVGNLAPDIQGKPAEGQQRLDAAASTTRSNGVLDVRAIAGVPPRSLKPEPSQTSSTQPSPAPNFGDGRTEPIDASAPPFVGLPEAEPTIGSPAIGAPAEASAPPRPGSLPAPAVPPAPTAAPTAAPPPVPVPAPAPVPPPVPPPPPAPVPVPPPVLADRLLFVADAETGDASQWCFVHSGVPVGIVTSPVRAGSFAYKAEVRDGVMIYDSERSEYANGPGGCGMHRFREGDETWTAVSVFPQADFPTFNHWSLVTQWKEPYGGTPPQQISLQSDGWAIVGAGSLSPRPRFNFGTIQRGAWNDLLVHHRWSPDPNIGFVEVYMNGALALPRTYTRTMENSNPLFLSVGHYRDGGATTGTAVLYIDDVRVGTTRASVGR